MASAHGGGAASRASSANGGGGGGGGSASSSTPFVLTKAHEQSVLEGVGIVRALTPPDDARALFDVAVQIFHNILTQPHDAQRRRLKTSSPAFVAKFGRVEHSTHLLALLGWTERDGALRFEHTDLAPLRFGIRVLWPYTSQAAAGVPCPVSSAAAPASAAAASASASASASAAAAAPAAAAPHRLVAPGTPPLSGSSAATAIHISPTASPEPGAAAAAAVHHRAHSGPAAAPAMRAAPTAAAAPGAYPVLPSRGFSSPQPGAAPAPAAYGASPGDYKQPAPGLYPVLGRGAGTTPVKPAVVLQPAPVRLASPLPVVPTAAAAPKPAAPAPALTPYDRAVQELTAFGFAQSDAVCALRLCGAVAPSSSSSATDAAAAKQPGRVAAHSGVSGVSGVSGGASVVVAAAGAPMSVIAPAPVSPAAAAAAAAAARASGPSTLPQVQAAALELLLACDGHFGEANLRAVLARQQQARDEQRRREEALSLAFVQQDAAQRARDHKAARDAEAKASDAALRATLKADVQRGNAALTPEQWNFVLAPPTHTSDSVYTCNVCFADDLKLADVVVLECAHLLCRGCMARYMRERIDGGRSKDMACPEVGCKRLLTEREVRRGVESPVVFDKYLSFLLDAHLRLDPDCRWCPKPGCGTAMLGSADHPMTRCPNPKCQYCFCFRCKVDWHADVTCDNYQKWKRDNGAADSKFEEWRKQHTKPCPRCRGAIEKNGGCNHMTCVGCRYEFCWLCLEGPYKAGHYTLDEKSKCYGKQYT